MISQPQYFRDKEIARLSNAGPGAQHLQGRGRVHSRGVAPHSNRSANAYFAERIPPATRWKTCTTRLSNSHPSGGVDGHLARFNSDLIDRRMR